MASSPSGAPPPAVRSGLARARALFNRGDFWGACQALQALWPGTSPFDRSSVQGLFQVGAAMHKLVVQDDRRGARLLLDRAIARLDDVRDGALGVDFAALRAEARAWRARIETGDLPAGPVFGLPRLDWSAAGAADRIRVDAARLVEVEHVGRRAVLVSLEADGLAGWGECRLPWGVFGVWDALVEAVLPALFAEPVTAPVEVAETWGEGVACTSAVAGVEAALWDLWARRAGVGLPEALGYSARAVALSGRLNVGDPALLARELDGLIAGGYRHVLVPARPNADRRVLPDLVADLPVPFAVDLGGAYRAADIRALQVLDALGPTLLAQPVPSWDLWQAARIARGLGSPVSLGDWPGEAGAQGALASGACAVVHVDPGASGLAAAVRILTLVEREHVGAWVTSSAATPVGALADLAVAAHAGATLPADLSRALDADGNRAVAPGSDGSAAPPPGVGLDYVPDPTWLRSVTVRATELRS